jgi:hypothetical protein
VQEYILASSRSGLADQVRTIRSVASHTCDHVTENTVLPLPIANLSTAPLVQTSSLRPLRKTLASIDACSMKSDRGCRYWALTILHRPFLELVGVEDPLG